MPELVRPTATLRVALAEALTETRMHSHEADRWSGSPVPEGRSWSDAVVHDDAAFAAFVEAERSADEEHAPRPRGFVPSTILWWVDGDRWLGRLSLRHRLSPYLFDVGGHVGYFVLPSARRQGHATAMLGESLTWALDLGLERVLVTCDADHGASRRVIEANGGRLEDRRGVKLRFWLPTARKSRIDTS